MDVAHGQLIDALEAAMKAAIHSGFAVLRVRLGGSVEAPQLEQSRALQHDDPWPESLQEQFRVGTTGRWLVDRLRGFPNTFDFVDLEPLVSEYKRWRPHTSSARATINNALGFLRERGCLSFDATRRGRYHKRRPPQ